MDLKPIIVAGRATLARIQTYGSQVPDTPHMVGLRPACLNARVSHACTRCRVRVRACVRGLTNASAQDSVDSGDRMIPYRVCGTLVQDDSSDRVSSCSHDPKGARGRTVSKYTNSLDLQDLE